jgi:hypothetical protein
VIGFDRTMMIRRPPARSLARPFSYFLFPTALSECADRERERASGERTGGK